MKLSVKERIILLNVLPDQGTYVNMLVIRDLTGELGFSEADHAHLGLVEENGDVKWDDDKDVTKDVPIGPVAYAVIQKAFKKLDSGAGLTTDLMPVYERFVVEEVEVQTLEELSGT